MYSLDTVANHALRKRQAAAAVGLCLLALLATGLGPVRVPVTPGSHEYQARIQGAMIKMHSAMSAPASGDVDLDFAVLMIPHHQAAVDMAEAVLLYGKDERVKRLAQKIIVEQRQDLEVLRSIVASRRGSKGSRAPQDDVR